MASISLYDASVTSYLQILDAASGFLEKSLAHCKENNIDPESIVESRIFEDMQPFWYQIQSLVFHSAGAAKGIVSGNLKLPDTMKDPTYASCQALVAGAVADLRAMTPEQVNARAGEDVVFQVGERRREFTAENFLMSFSLPNFHFHTSMAYAILRAKGFPVGKMDFIGKTRPKS